MDKLNADRKFEPHETYAPILQEIFTMYADGHTIKYIVDYLDGKKIRSYRGGKINGTGVQRMLSRNLSSPEDALREGKVSAGQRWACGALGSWRGNGPPNRRCVGVLRGRSPTLVLRHGPDSYGRQQ